MKHIIAAATGMALAAASCPSFAQEPQSPEEIANLSLKGFAQFQCAALAGFAEDAKAGAHFNAGITDLRQFLTLARARNDKAVEDAISRKTPMIITMALGGPTIDFEIGRVYSAVLQYVDDELRDRETWTHQKHDPDTPSPDAEIVKLRAEQQYRTRNCGLLM